MFGIVLFLVFSVVSGFTEKRHLNEKNALSDNIHGHQNLS